MRLPIRALRFVLLWPIQKFLREKTKMEDLNAIFSPGMLVKHPAHPEWGTGQVQSNIGAKLTVNFVDEGKIVIDSTRVALLAVFDG